MSLPLVKLIDVAKIITGSTPSKNKIEYYGSEIPFITPRELTDSEIKEPKVYLSKSGAKVARVLPIESVLVCCIGSLGKVGFTRTEVATNQQINSLIFNKNEVLPRYGYYCCKRLKPILNNIAPATTVAIVNKSKFSELKIPLPSLEKQKRIADILDKADALRQKRQQTIELADQFLHSVFLDMFGDPVKNPKNWKVKFFGGQNDEMRYGTSQKCSANKINGALPVLRIPNIVNQSIDNKNLVFATLSENAKQKLLLKKGDLLFVRTNGNPNLVGRCSVFSSKQKTLFASYLIRLRLAEGSAWTPEFIQACFSCTSFRRTLLKEVKTTAGNYNLSTQGLKNLKIPVPQKELQIKFTEIKNKNSESIRNLNLDLISLESLFNSLTQRAFRGEL